MPPRPPPPQRPLSPTWARPAPPTTNPPPAPSPPSPPRRPVGTFPQIEPQVLNRNFQVNVMGLLHLARRFAPAMVEAGKGALIVTGNTSALRGKANFAGFAPTKAAQRILAESIARDLGP